ncbi:MAG: hypothetical protein PHQ27_08230, partial [Victivallales bacterium]|nr:hypothetical protein [Victivallales bacterium]
MRKLIGFILLAALMAVGNHLSADNEHFIKAERLKRQGNYREALKHYTALLAPQKEYRLDGDELRGALFCLYQLGQLDDFDRMVTAAVAAHPHSAPTLWAAAVAYAGIPHDGCFRQGRFCRGYRHDGDKYVNARRRDRVMAIRYFLRVMALLRNPREPGVVIDRAAFFRDFARTVYQPQETWQLSYLTDLTRLPDYDEFPDPLCDVTGGAPVNAAGAPVFYHLPKSFQTARNDGERWRWLLAQQAENGDAVGSKLTWA